MRRKDLYCTPHKQDHPKSSILHTYIHAQEKQSQIHTQQEKDTKRAKQPHNSKKKEKRREENREYPTSPSSPSYTPTYCLSQAREGGRFRSSIPSLILFSISQVDQERPFPFPSPRKVKKKKRSHSRHQKTRAKKKITKPANRKETFHLMGII